MSLLRFLQRLTAQWNAIARTPTKQVLGINSNVKNRDQPFYHHDPLTTSERFYRHATGITRWTVLEVIDDLLADTEEQFTLIYQTLFNIRFGDMMRPPAEAAPVVEVAPPPADTSSGWPSLLTWAATTRPMAVPIPFSSDSKHVPPAPSPAPKLGSSPSLPLPSPSPSEPSVMNTFSTNLMKNEHKQEIQARINALQTIAKSLQSAIGGLKNTEDAPGYRAEESATYKERCDALIQKIDHFHKDKLTIYLATLERVYGHLKVM